MGISRKIPVTILTGAVAAMLSCPGMVMAKTKMHTASDTKVTTVTSIRDIGGRSSTENSVVTVDTSTGGVVVGNEKKSFKKAFGRNFSKVKGSSKAKTKITMTSSNRNILVIDKNNFCKIKKSGAVKITMTAKETKKYQKATKTITLNVKKLDKTKKKCRYIKAKKVNKSQKTSKR